ncbi:MAG: menaquinone biosynthesis protein [Chitinophagales bacterium]|nr:menaquinone biosynthesis protein [Bacteroidota bacterium]
MKTNSILNENLKYKISAVAYLNTKPLLHGLENTEIANHIIISQDTPAECAEKLLNDEVDIGLVPVAIIPLLSKPIIVSPYCIGADGTVKTVCLFAEQPLEEIHTIYLDYQSRTSVLLVQLLMKEYWKKEVKFLPATAGYENQVKGQFGAVIIGDRAIAAMEKYPYQYDLAEAWKKHTGLPFVFAAWVSNKEIDQAFLNAFNSALQYGWDNRNQLLAQYEHYNSSHFSVEQYWSSNIQYALDDKKKQALELFMQKLHPTHKIMYCY